MGMRRRGRTARAHRSLGTRVVARGLGSLDDGTGRDGGRTAVACAVSTPEGASTGVAYCAGNGVVRAAVASVGTVPDAECFPVNRSVMKERSTMSIPATKAIAARRRMTRAGTNVEIASRPPAFAGTGEGRRSRRTMPGTGRSTTTFGPAGSDVRARCTPCSA